MNTYKLQIDIAEVYATECAELDENRSLNTYWEIDECSLTIARGEVVGLEEEDSEPTKEQVLAALLGAGFSAACVEPHSSDEWYAYAKNGEPIFKINLG